jgi:hypothetical protein
MDILLFPFYSLSNFLFFGFFFIKKNILVGMFYWPNWGNGYGPIQLIKAKIRMFYWIGPNWALFYLFIYLFYLEICFLSFGGVAYDGTRA